MCLKEQPKAVIGAIDGEITNRNMNSRYMAIQKLQVRWHRRVKKYRGYLQLLFQIIILAQLLQKLLSFKVRRVSL